jgi:site-specific DNA-methyltransferase (adenine-specific)
VTPYYQDESVTIYHGDCRETLPQLSDVDLVFTSPPYNLGVTSGGGFAKAGKRAGKWSGGALANGYETSADAMPLDEYERWQRSVLTACWNSLAPTGAIFYNHKPRVQGGELWTPLTLNPGIPIRQIIVWARAGGLNFAPTHFVPTYEWIIVFAKESWRLKSKGASGVGDLWRVPQESNSEHPAPFPVGLPGRAIEATAPSLVLDPFMGSGTTLRAAKDAGVRSIGIEVSEHYCEIAARRMAQEVLAL